MKKLLAILCAAALALSLAACGADSTTGTSTSTTGTADAAYTRYTIDGATALTFSDKGITATDGGDTAYEIDGTALTITGAGTYVVSGSCADGSIQVKKGVTGVILVLNGLSLTSADTAPITCAKSSGVVIAVADGTSNSLADTAMNNDETSPDNDKAENAVIKCKDGSQVTICGSGTLTVTANGKNGIKSGAATTEEGDASLTIREVSLTIDAPVNDAINAEALLNVESGTLTISAGDDAIHSDLALNIGADDTDGPAIAITSCYEGLEAAALAIRSGNITIQSSDDCLNAANSDLGRYDFTMTISGGTITAYSSGGDGFDSNGSLTISGGSVAVWTANTADNQPLDADGTITISGGTVLAAGGSSDMGMSLTAEQPCVTFSFAGGMDGRPGSDTSTASSRINQDSAVGIQDASGNAVYSGTAVCSAGFVFFSSADLTADDSYTLYAADTEIAAAAAQTGVSSGGFGGGQPGQPGQPGGQSGDGQQPPEMPDNGQQPPDVSGDGRQPGQRRELNTQQSQ